MHIHQHQDYVGLTLCQAPAYVLHTVLSPNPHCNPRPAVPSGGHSAPQEHWAVSGDMLGCHTVQGREGYWHLVGQGQECCQTAYHATTVPITRNDPAQRSMVLRLENLPCRSALLPFPFYRGGNGGSDRVSALPEATQQVSNRARIQIWAAGCRAWAVLTPPLTGDTA